MNRQSTQTLRTLSSDVARERDGRIRLLRRMLSDKCPYCGHLELEEGTVQSTGKVYFRPKKMKFLTMLEALVNVEARVCPRCGHVLLFASPEKLKALQKEKQEESTEGGER